MISVEGLLIGHFLKVYPSDRRYLSESIQEIGHSVLSFEKMIQKPHENATNIKMKWRNAGQEGQSSRTSDKPGSYKKPERLDKLEVMSNLNVQIIQENESPERLEIAKM